MLLVRTCFFLSKFFINTDEIVINVLINTHPGISNSENGINPRSPTSSRKIWKKYFYVINYLPLYRSSLGFFTTMTNLIGIIKNRLAYSCFLIFISWSIQQVNELWIMLWAKMHAKIILQVFWLSWNVSFCSQVCTSFIHGLFAPLKKYIHLFFPLKKCFSFILLV